MKKLLYFLSLPIIAVGVMAFAEEKVNTIYKHKSTGKILQPIEVKEYPLVINDEKNRASWSNSFDSFRFSPANISLNKIQIKNYNGFHYYVNPNSLTINMIEQVNKFIGKRYLALVITEKELDDQGNLSKLGLALKHLRTNQVSQTEVFNMTELREKGKNGAFFIIEGYDKNFKKSGILFNEGFKDLTISWGEKDIIYTINQTSDLSIAKKRIIYRVSPDKFNLITFEKVKAYFAEEGFALASKNEIFDKNHNLVSLTIQINNGKEKVEKQIILNDLRHLVKSKNIKTARTQRADESIVIEANKETQEVKISYDNRWFDLFRKSGNYEILKVTNNVLIPKIDSSRFTHLLSVPTALPSNSQIYGDDILLVAGENYIKKDYRFYLDKKYSKLKVQYEMNDKFFTLSLGKTNPSNIVFYPDLTKLNQVEFPDMRFSSKTPVFLAKNENKPFSHSNKSLSYFSKIKRNQDTLRTILETNKLGKNPLVFINGEEYPSSILYRIDPDEVISTTFCPPNNKSGIEQFGEAARDGIIKISTKEDDFIFKNDKHHKVAVENLKKRLIESKKRVRRQIYQNSNGVKYEEISIISINTGSPQTSVKLPFSQKGYKVNYFIDGKLASEEETSNSSDTFIFVSVGKDKVLEEKYKEELKDSEVNFIIRTKRN